MATRSSLIQGIALVASPDGAGCLRATSCLTNTPGGTHVQKAPRAACGVRLPQTGGDRVHEDNPDLAWNCCPLPSRPPVFPGDST